jgi:hypothetical protein
MMRSRGELLGYVDATDAAGAEVMAAAQFRLERAGPAVSGVGAGAVTVTN